MISVLKRIRIAAAAVPVAAALVLTGCSSDSSDGDDSKDKEKQSPSASAPADEQSEAPGEEGDEAGAGDGKGLTGSWLSSKGGDAVALVITGKQAGLFATGGSVCSGTAGEESGMQMIRLKCQKPGDDDRSEGHVKSVDEKKLVVSWEGSGTETFQRTEGGGLPTGLPSPSVPAS
ncbi:hypothetical protein [Streptomyces sp. SCSIO ZS0520]|uniref:hypothetical protein n=1 Tax=Streptomyces sp. SCSIO ZS0520 TaxID=2892996 RepID=UPI0021DB1D8C|nr:hypothetical protein [Streptomyces sp. SCSIO ZS0520]